MRHRGDEILNSLTPNKPNSFLSEGSDIDYSTMNVQ
jgi:hypothetical protein